MRSKEFWDIVESGVAEPTAKETLIEAQAKALSDRKLKDLKAKNYLFQVIDHSILESILQRILPNKFGIQWKKKYSSTYWVKQELLQSLARESKTLQMKSVEPIVDFIGRTMGVANKMRFLGADMEDAKIVTKILRSMDSKWDYVVCSIEESKDISLTSIDELQIYLICHE